MVLRKIVTHWLALSVKLHRTMILSIQSAIYCFSLLFHDHIFIYMGSKQTCLFPTEIWLNKNVCNRDHARNIIIKTKSHLIRYDKLTIKKQGLHFICGNAACRILPENLPCTCSMATEISALQLINNVTSWQTQNIDRYVQRRKDTPVI